MKPIALLLFIALAMPAKSTPLDVQIHYVDTVHDAVSQASAYARKIKGADVRFPATNSMEPHFPVGHTAIVYEPGEPTIGQPVAFRVNGAPMIYTHQVTSKGLGRYVTSGTNVAGPDAGYRTRKDLVGVVRHVWVAKKAN